MHSEHTSLNQLFLQGQAMKVDGCGQHLQQLSLLDEDRQRLLLLEEEKQRVAALRRMQIESEQFRYFEDQLRRQELANKRGEEAMLKVLHHYLDFPIMCHSEVVSGTLLHCLVLFSLKYYIVFFTMYNSLQYIFSTLLYCSSSATCVICVVLFFFCLVL